ncbi:hypothetical protein PybrP1_004245 [[Pythium] brassicae (nom. inval.)]|nr:hypothetical protein PybrP1_004245 [[Pythium] brassicae (nom. inval.)]
MSSPEDFSYRALSDTDEQHRARRAMAQHPAEAASSFVEVTSADAPVDVHHVHLGSASHGGLLAEAASAADQLHASSSDDWAVEEQGREEVRSHQFAFADGARRGSMRGPVAARLARAVATLHRIDMHEHHGTVPPSPKAAAALTDQPSANLHGKDLRQFLAIGSIARGSNSVDWSETMANGTDEPDHLSLMDPYYDLTRSKLAKLFSLFQPDESGMVSYDGFRRGLEAMGIMCGNDEEFEVFISKVDEDHSGGISFDEFQHAIQEIKLAQLFDDGFVHEMGLDNASDVQPSRLGAIEYSPDRIRSVYPIQNVEKFMYSRKPSWATVRWINVEGSDALAIRRLSVRYCLHPLAVEDALDIDRERPKYEKYEEHSSLILQTIHAADLNMLKTYQRMYRASLYTKDGAPSQFERMDKRELEERLKELQLGSVMTRPEQLSIYVLKDVLISVQESTTTLWTVVKTRLDTSYSRIRQHGTHFLLYSIVDACVDELTPIVHTFGAKLAMLERLLHLDQRTFDIDRFQSTSKQLKGLRRLCTPLREAIVQMCESNDFDSEILRYFRDVQDHIAIVEEDCEKHLDTCKSLIEEFHTIRAAQQSAVSLYLTMVAAVFLPATFLTGLYGMNFDNMPELHDHNGYYVWWAVLITVVAITMMSLKKLL